MKTSLLCTSAAFTLAASVASAYPVMVYRAVDSSLPVYTLHDPGMPLYIQKSKAVYSSFLLRDFGDYRQTSIKLGVEGRVKVFRVNVTTAGDWNTLVTEDYGAGLRSYTYPISLNSTVSTTVHFELRSVAPTPGPTMGAGTYYLRGTDKTYLLAKSQYEVDAPPAIVGHGLLWDISFYQENPANLRDFNGTMITTSIVTTSYGLSLPYSDLVNIDTDAPIQENEPGTLPFAAARMAQYLTAAGYQIRPW